MGGGRHGIVVDHAGMAVAEGLADILKKPENENKIDIFGITGAYVASDSSVASILVSNRSSLRSVKLDVCPLVASLSASALFALPDLSELSLSFSRPGFFGPLLHPSSSLKPAFLGTLTSLTLSGAGDCDDRLVAALLPEGPAGDRPRLAHLDLSGTRVTDVSLETIRRGTGETLLSLDLSLAKSLTAPGLSVFFSPDPSLGPPVSLKRLSLASCGAGSDAVTDEVVALACGTSDAAGNGDGLTALNVSGGGAGVGDKGMEAVARHCRVSVTELDVSFCHGVTDRGLGYLVEKCRGLRKVSVWGLAQLTDDFHDGHARRGREGEGGGLEIVGNWMKKTVGGAGKRRREGEEEEEGQ